MFLWILDKKTDITELDDYQYLSIFTKSFRSFSSFFQFLLLFFIHCYFSYVIFCVLRQHPMPFLRWKKKVGVRSAQHVKWEKERERERESDEKIGDKEKAHWPDNYCTDSLPLFSLSFFFVASNCCVVVHHHPRHHHLSLCYSLVCVLGYFSLSQKHRWSPIPPTRLHLSTDVISTTTGT